jgi:prepilin signal peptidase PulO-like enzyme (type II secretory pathway)
VSEITAISFLFGASLGSFVNVCAYRIPRGVSVVSGRSFCPSCGRVLRWFELIPIASFLVVCRGRCTRCSAPIPFQYPVVEFLSGVCVVLAVFTGGLSAETMLLVLFALSMLLVALIDWQHYRIPNKVLIWSLSLAIAIKATTDLSTLWPALLACSVSFTATFLLLLSGRFAFGREVMGMGDVKLAAVIAFVLGVSGLLLSVWLGAIGGLVFAGVRKVHCGREAENTERIPFGSFLALSSVLLALYETIPGDFIHFSEAPWLSF